MTTNPLEKLTATLWEAHRGKVEELLQQAQAGVCPKGWLAEFAAVAEALASQSSRRSKP